MPFTGHLVRFTFGGKHYTKESWTNTLHLRTLDPVTQPSPALVLDAFAAYLDCMSIASYIDYWKWNELAPSTGRYAFEDSHTYEVAPAAQGTRPLSAPQLCVVGTLGTAATRGPAHVGRIYMPTSHPAASDGVATNTDAVNLQNRFKTFIEKVNSLVPACHVGVWSQQYQTFREITQVGVGRVTDTQRSRRTSLPEGTVRVNIAAPPL